MNSPKTAGTSSVMAVASAQRANDMRRLERASGGAGATPRRGGARPPAPAPPVEVSATELESLRATLVENTAELQRSQTTLKVRRLGRGTPNVHRTNEF
jgi:hypothetical protein